MQPASFINFIADALAVDRATVGVFARELRKARLLTTGARGVNAPHMLPVDAARMLIALMATDRPSEAVASVERWRAMTVRHLGDAAGDLPEYVFVDGPTLEQALVRLLALDPDPQRWSYSFPSLVIARNEKSAVLEWGLNEPPRAVFRDGMRSLADRQEMAGIRTSCLVAPAVLLKIAAEMWADRFNGCDGQGNPLDLKHPWNNQGTPAQVHARYQEIYDYLRVRDADWRKKGGD